MQVTALVVNWNGAAQLGACLDALLGQDHDGLEVVVVDNASADDSLDVLAPWVRDHGVRVVANPTNRGFAGGVNDGLDASDAPLVLVSNYDIRPAPDFVSRAVAALLADDRRGAVQGKLVRFTLAPNGADVIDTTGHLAFTTRLFRNRGEGQIDRGQFDDPGEVFGASGALVLYRRAMLDDLAIPVAGRGVEVFDEDLFAYFEDVDLDWRAQRRGWTCWYEPTAVARHERGGAGVRRTPKVERLNFANRLLVVVKHDTFRSVGRAWPGVVATTTLKLLELLFTVPQAVPGAVSDLRRVRVMRAKRAWIDVHATVAASEVVDRWFQPFDYLAWVRTWWGRVRGVPVGTEPPR